MRLLGVARFVFEEARRFGQCFGAVDLADDLANFADRLVGEVDCVGTHVGDETYSAVAVVDTFI